MSDGPERQGVMGTTTDQYESTASRREPLPGALARALYSHCPRCGNVRAFTSQTDWFECPCGYRACTHCHEEIVKPLAEIGR